MVHMVDNGSSLSSLFSPYPRSYCDRSMNSGNKRARSPEVAESYEDRPAKRPSLAVGEFNRRQLSHSSAASSRQGSEDWVQRAGGLTIDSPNYTPGEHYPFLPQDDGIIGVRRDEGLGEGDVDMAMEPEEDEGRMEETQEGEVVAVLPQLQASSFGPTNGSHQQQSQQYQGARTPHRHPYPTRYSERKQSIIPLINVAPATTMNTHASHQQYHIGASNTSNQLADTTPTTPPFSPTPMAVSPPSSFSQLTPTKRRVVFGPRANCEKCRLGIPGHFIHYE